MLAPLGLLALGFATACVPGVPGPLPELLAEPYFALSFEICEIDPDTTWKKNSIHPRLRGTA